jgi:hypothetical protein
VFLFSIKEKRGKCWCIWSNNNVPPVTGDTSWEVLEVLVPSMINPVSRQTAYSEPWTGSHAGLHESHEGPNIMHIRLLLMKKNHHLWSASSSVPTSGDEPILCLFLFLRFFQDVSSAFTWLFEENSCFFSPDLRNHQIVKVLLRIGDYLFPKSCSFVSCLLEKLT